LHDRTKRPRVETRTADECAVELFFGHESLGVLRLHTAAVENSHVPGDVVPKRIRSLPADGAMRVGSHLGRSSFSGAYGPHRFVRDNDAFAPVAADVSKRPDTLSTKDVVSQLGFALLQDFTDAD